MNRPFLFLAGEFRISMPLAFKRENWSHTMTAKLLIEEADGRIHREEVHEDLKGVLYFASVDNEEVKMHNLRLISRRRLPCWPPAGTLLGMADRHLVMSRCVALGLVDHHVQFRYGGTEIDFPCPYVVKTGNLHQGHGKHLVRKASEVPEWNGLATIEPFFEGQSFRVLLIGDQAFGIKFDNPDSWIKNSQGADVSVWNEVPQEAIEHAREVADCWGLKIAGVDYILDKFGGIHFLEVNQFPGLDTSDEIAECASIVLESKMDLVEAMAND